MSFFKLWQFLKEAVGVLLIDRLLFLQCTGKNPTFFSPNHKGIIYYLACQLKLRIRRSKHLGGSRIKISWMPPPYVATKWPAPVIQALFMLYINGPRQGNQAANEQHMLLSLWLPRLHFQRQYTADIPTTVPNHPGNYTTKYVIRLTYLVILNLCASQIGKFRDCYCCLLREFKGKDREEMMQRL